MAINANRSSLPAEVVNAGVEILEEAMELSPQVCASTINTPLPEPCATAVKFAVADCRRVRVTDRDGGLNEYPL